jgi:hypothetical protein
VVVALATAALAAPLVEARQGLGLFESDSVAGIPRWALIAAAANVLVLGGLTAFAARIRARRRRGEALLLTEMSAESATAAAPAVSAAAEAAVADPPKARAPEELELVRLAVDYLEIVGSGSRQPVVQLAARRSWNVERTRRALARARTRGLLLSAGRGRVGGTLSPRAQQLLGASPSPVAPAHDQPQPRPRLVDRADLVVHEPRGDPDLAHDLLGEVGRHARRPLGPRDPEAPVGSYRRARRG